MKLNERQFDDAVRYLEEGLFNKFKKKQQKPAINIKQYKTTNIKEYKTYSKALVGEQFKGYDCDFPFFKITPRAINSQERANINRMVRDGSLDEDEAETYLTWKVVGLFNGGEAIALGNEKSAEYYIDFELDMAGYID